MMTRHEWKTEYSRYRKQVSDNVGRWPECVALNPRGFDKSVVSAYRSRLIPILCISEACSGREVTTEVFTNELWDEYGSQIMGEYECDECGGPESEGAAECDWCDEGICHDPLYMATLYLATPEQWIRFEEESDCHSSHWLSEYAIEADFREYV